MRIRSMLLMAVVASIAVVVPSAASAATLYTTSAHTTAVPVGTKFTTVAVKTSEPQELLFETIAGLPWGGCSESTISYQVTKNSKGVFEAAINGATMGSCFAMIPESLGGELEVVGGSTTVGTTTAWLGTTFKNFRFKSVWGWSEGTLTSATGNPPVKGMFVEQPTATKAPVSVVMNEAGVLNGGKMPTRLTAKYTVTGAAAAYSFG